MTQTNKTKCDFCWKELTEHNIFYSVEVCKIPMWMSFSESIEREFDKIHHICEKCFKKFRYKEKQENKEK